MFIRWDPRLVRRARPLPPVRVWPAAAPAVIMGWGDTEPALRGFLPSLIEEMTACQVGRPLTEPAHAGRCVKLLLSLAIAGSREVERTVGITHGSVLITLL